MRRSKHKKNVTEEVTVEAATGLPPRRNRLARRQKERRMRFFLAGLYLFGAIAIGQIGYELYLASKNMPTVNYHADKETTIAEVQKEGDPGNTSQAPNATPEGDASATVAKTSPAAMNPGTSPNSNSGGVSTLGGNAVSQPKPTANTLVAKQVPVQKPVTQPVTQPVTKKTQTQPQTTAQQTDKPRLVRHRVVAGDTLFKLSRAYYGNGMGVERIARQNHLNLEAPLPIGRVIYIPMR